MIMAELLSSHLSLMAFSSQSAVLRCSTYNSRVCPFPTLNIPLRASKVVSNSPKDNCSSASSGRGGSRARPDGHSSNNAGNGRVTTICRAAGRREFPGSGEIYGQLLITKEIAACSSVTDLETVFTESGSNLSPTSAAAALSKYAKLPRSRDGGTTFLKALLAQWLKKLPAANYRGCANVLWVLGKLGVQGEAWDRTWSAFLAHVERDLMPGLEPNVQPQELSSALWATAKLGKQPSTDELQVLLQAFLQPGILAAAAAQAVSNVVWALGQLSQLPGWQAEVSPQTVQLLLGEQQLLLLAGDGTPQAISNVAMSIARLGTGPSPLVSRAAAQQHATLLLEHIPTGRSSIRRWKPQDITNMLWACGELGLVHTAFLGAAVANMSTWVAHSGPFDITQAVGTCVQLQLKDVDLMSQLLQRTQQLLQPQAGSKQGGRRSGAPRGAAQRFSAADKALLAALCASAVADLDLRSLASPARALIVASRIGSSGKLPPATSSKVGRFHNWLMQHKLLDCQGVAHLLAGEQLQEASASNGR